MISFRVVNGVVQYLIKNDGELLQSPWKNLNDNAPCDQLSLFLRMEGYKGF